jgi:hypothetical protein
MDRPIIFKCPRTSMNVQHFLADEPASEGEYKAVVCQACKRVHFIHSISGKLLGEREK